MLARLRALARRWRHRKGEVMPQRRLAVLRVVCAWCGAVISEGSGETSHGICPDCLKIERQKWGAK